MNKIKPLCYHLDTYLNVYQILFANLAAQQNRPVFLKMSMPVPHPQGFCFNWNKMGLIYQLFFYSLLISHLYGIFNCLRFISCKTVLIGQVSVGNWIPHSSAYWAERLRCLYLPWSIFLSLPYSFSQRRQVAVSAAAVADHHWKGQRKNWAASWIFFPGKVNLPCFFPFFSTSWKKLFFFLLQETNWTYCWKTEAKSFSTASQFGTS